MSTTVEIRTYEGGVLKSTRTLTVADPSLNEANEATIRTQAAAALATNKTIVSGADTYLAIGSPTAGQVTAEVRALTQAAKLHAQQNSGIIRLILGALDATD